MDWLMDLPTFNYGLAGGGSGFWGSHTQVDFASCASWWNRKASFDVEEARRGEDRAYDQGKEVGGTHPAGQREQRNFQAGYIYPTGSTSYQGNFLMEWSKFNITIFKEQQMKKFTIEYSRTKPSVTHSASYGPSHSCPRPAPLTCPIVQTVSVREGRETYGRWCWREVIEMFVRS